MENTETRPQLTVLMPVYNEEDNIESAVRVVSEKLSSSAYSFELLIIDDGSTDDTVKIIRNLINTRPQIRLHCHEFNRGAGNAFLSGISKVEGAFTIFIPADIGMNIDQISKYIEAAKDADIVVGLRSDRKDYTLFRKIVSCINIFMIKLLFGMKERQFNYISMYRSEIFKHFNIESRSVFITAEIMIKARDLGFKLKEVEIEYLPRRYGNASGASPKSICKAVRDMLKLWIKRSITANKPKPRH